MLYEAISGRFPNIFPKIRIDLELPIDKVGNMGIIQDKQRERRASHESRHDAGNEHADVPLHALCRHVLFLYAKRAFVSTGISAELSDITRYLYDIELVEFDLYNLPNDALHAGDIDLHACVTQAYFESDAQEQGFDDLSVLGYTLIAPLSLYSNRVGSVEELKALAGPVQ